MTSTESLLRRLQRSLSNGLLEHALNVLADATSSTVVLFDHAGEVVLGPIAGHAMIRDVLGTEQGRALVLDAHRAAVARHMGAGERDGNLLEEGPLDHFAIPVIYAGLPAGALTLGDRTREPLEPEWVARLETAAGLRRGALTENAAAFPPWDATEASAARNMAALVTEMFADLFAQEETLRTRIEELTAVYNIAGLLSGTDDLQHVLDRTTHLVCDVMKAKACSIRLLDESTGNLVIRAVHNLSDEYLNKGPVTVTENPIDGAAMAGEVVHISDAPNDPRTRYPDQARQEGIVSGLVCGLIYRGDAVGVLRVYTGKPHVFTAFDESLLRAVAAQSAAAIVNARLVQETIEAERVARQIAYAGEVQRRMIPAEPPCCHGIEIGTVYRPTYNVGGDFYDFISLPKGNLGLAIADVSGKGVPASLLMASLRSALRVYACFTYDIDKIMAEVNRHVCRETKVSEFATAFYGVLSPDARRLTYCNAGHDPPMLLRGGNIRHLETGGMALGVDDEARFDRGVLDLQSDDVLMLYTDGAVEALNFHDEPFGRERLAESFLRYAPQPVKLIAKNILWDIRRFRGLADRTDDLTMVVVRIGPDPDAGTLDHTMQRRF